MPLTIPQGLYRASFKFVTDPTTNTFEQKRLTLTCSARTTLYT